MAQARSSLELPFSARSVIASTLLGTHPPTLPGRLLVALADRFGISEGTARVALSRMVDKGELLNRDGDYTLAGHLLARQRRQDTSLHPAATRWDGRWAQAVITESADAAVRAARRASLGALKLAELREGVWLRPDNLERGRLGDEPAWRAPDILWAVAEPQADPVQLAARLFDLGGWATTATGLIGELAVVTHRLSVDDDDVLAPGFGLSAAVLRHFVADPELPEALVPEDWPGPALRAGYRDFDAAYRGRLRRFFRAHR